MNMRKILKSRIIFLAVINVITIIAIAVLSVIGHSIASSQKYNFAAERWSQEKGGYTQISCYFANDSGFTFENVDTVRNSIASSMTNSGVDMNETVIPDSYYAQLGKFTVTCDRNASSQAEITAVGGRFFLFRSFNLLKGAYFSENDNMHDSIVIDRSLAFKLYGSENVIGFPVYLNGVKFVIAGVIADPQTKYENECSGDIPHAYIPYREADKLYDKAEIPKNLNCYECILPEPVDDLAYNTVESVFAENYKDKYIIVKNTDRFSSKVRLKHIKSMNRSAVMDKAIELPYWENASRMAEYDVSILYGIRRILFVVPLLTLLLMSKNVFRERHILKQLGLKYIKRFMAMKEPKR